MNTPNSTDAARTRAAMRGPRLLVAGDLGVSVLTLAAIAVLRDHTAVVTDAVWVRATIVVGSALLSYAFAVRAARGSRRALLRLRIVSAIMLLAIVAIIAVPDAFPLWMKIEQGVCGVLLLAVVARINGRRVRSAFAAGAAGAVSPDRVPAGRG
jgi:hypothetical protein